VKDIKLTAKQAAFVREYVVDFNGAQAATRAGFSAKTAREKAAQLLKIPHISAAVKDAISSRDLDNQRRADDVLRDLLAVKNASMAMRVDKYGNPEMTDPSAAIKALELEGKHLAMWTEKTQISGELTHKVTRIKLVDMDGDSNC
jgi:phage terminase small subunit